MSVLFEHLVQSSEIRNQERRGWDNKLNQVSLVYLGTLSYHQPAQHSLRSNKRFPVGDTMLQDTMCPFSRENCNLDRRYESTQIVRSWIWVLRLSFGARPARGIRKLQEPVFGF